RSGVGPGRRAAPRVRTRRGARGSRHPAPPAESRTTRRGHRAAVLAQRGRSVMSVVGVLGAGSWGTTLAVHLAGLGHEVRLWDIDPGHLAELEVARENRKFLAGIALPE